ncbi:hypothetical protein C2E23DRAFT_913160, partial [Lenzites betulinus]
SEDILVFPRVRALALRDVDDLHSVAVLHHAFPALRSLEFSTRENDIDTEEMRRDTARDAFAHPWGVLDRLCGAAESLYALGGAPRARLLEVYRVHSHPVLLSQLREVVLDTEPTQLVLHLGRGYSDISPNFFARDISNLVSFRSRTVAHLVLNMSVGCLGAAGRSSCPPLGRFYALNRSSSSFSVFFSVRYWTMASMVSQRSAGARLEPSEAAEGEVVEHDPLSRRSATVYDLIRRR